MAESPMLGLEIMDNLPAVLSGLVLPHIHFSGNGLMILILVLNVGISFLMPTSAADRGRRAKRSAASSGLWFGVRPYKVPSDLVQSSSCS